MSFDIGGLVSLPNLLDESLARDDLRTFRTIIEDCVGRKVSLQTEYLSSLLLTVVREQKIDFLAQLVSLSPVLSTNDAGETALHIAFRSFQSSSALCLLAATYGADRTTTYEGETFLHSLIRNENISNPELFKVLTWLLQRDDVHEILNMNNSQGQTAFDLAVLYHQGNSTLLRLLLKNNAASGGSILQGKSIGVLKDEGWRRSLLKNSETEQRNTLVQLFDEGTKSILKKNEKEERKRSKLMMHALKKRRIVEEKEYWNRLPLKHTLIQLNQTVFREKIELDEKSEVTAIISEFKEKEEGKIFFASGICEHNVLCLQRWGRGYLSRKHVYFQSRCPFSSPPTLASGDLKEENPEDRELSNENGRHGTLSSLSSSIPADRINQCVRAQVKYTDPLDVVSAFAVAAAVRYRFFLMKRAAKVIEDCRVKYLIKNKMLQCAGGRSKYDARIHLLTEAVTKALWRENFCSQMVSLLFHSRARFSPPSSSPMKLERIRKFQNRYYKYLLLAQFLVSFVELIYMGIIPRTPSRYVHSYVDMVLMSFEVVICLCLPLSIASVADIILAVSAFICTALSLYDWSIIVTFFVLKFPFVVRALAETHYGSNMYCRVVENVIYFLFALSPFILGVGGALCRFSARDSLLRTNEGNVFMVFSYLWNDLSPILTLFSRSVDDLELSSYPALYSTRNTVRVFELGMGETLVSIRHSLPTIVLLKLVVLIYFLTASVVGVHSAIKKDINFRDKVKLKRNKGRFISLEEAEPLDAHRAPNMEVLDNVVNGVVMENDLLTGKEAIVATLTENRFPAGFNYRRSHRGTKETLFSEKNAALSNTSIKSKSSLMEWNCEKENPGRAGDFDKKTIEIALQKSDRKGWLEGFVERQLTGFFFRRESNYAILVMLILGSIFPNNFAMECVFGVLLLVEFLVTCSVLRLEVLVPNAVPLIMRICYILVGVVPTLIPLASLRCLRLLEGWSSIYQIRGSLAWCVFYAFFTLITFWMITFVSSLQFLATHSGETSICSSTSDCLGTSIRELLISGWTNSLVLTDNEGPAMVILILVSQFIFIPFFLTLMLYPLLRLSKFIARFLRLVLQEYHNDMLEYLKHYFEGEKWYSHVRLNETISANVVVKLKLWRYSLGKVHRHNVPRYYSSESQESGNNGTGCAVLTEGISCGRFATFEECMPFKHQKKIFKVFSSFRRSMVFSYVGAAITCASIICVFVVTLDRIENSAFVGIATAVHLCAICADLFFIPFDYSALINVSSAIALLTSIIAMLSQNKSIVQLYEIRFLSVLRVAQIRVFPISLLSYNLRPYRSVIITSLFSFLVAGTLAYLAENLHAQLYLMSHRYSFVGANYSSLNYAQQLASHEWRNSYPNSEDAQKLFQYFFVENASIYMSIFDEWFLPAVCICTCFSYLLFSGSNFMDPNVLLVKWIPFLEDPIVVSRDRSGLVYLHWIGIISLILSSIFNCLVSPSTSSDILVYFGCETAFALAGIIHSIGLLSFNLNRCRRSCSLFHHQRSNISLIVLIGEAIILLCCIVMLLYHSFMFPLAISLAFEPFGSLISPSFYASSLASLRFLFLLVLLPRPLFLSVLSMIPFFLFIAALLVLYFLSAAMIIAELAAYRLKIALSNAIWREALDFFIRFTVSFGVPTSLQSWEPFNASAVYEYLVHEGIVEVLQKGEFSMSLLEFFLCCVGKVLIAFGCGVLITITVSPLSTLLRSELPSKTYRLYYTLCGGISRILEYGRKNHHDLSPDVREYAQRSKFKRVFLPHGIPLWTVPHLFEELNICRPSRQRRFMFAFEQLLSYISIFEKRHKLVKEFITQYEIYRKGGPAKLSFDYLPTFPPMEPDASSLNPYNNGVELGKKSAQYKRFVTPLRLVQALALFELNFPTDSSVRTQHWMGFFTVCQKIRAATMVQSLWRMYVEEELFDQQRSKEDRDTISNLRRAFRRNRMKENVRFRLYSSFSEAVVDEPCIFNPGSCHFDVINRLYRSKIDA